MSQCSATNLLTKIKSGASSAVEEHTVSEEELAALDASFEKRIEDNKQLAKSSTLRQPANLIHCTETAEVVKGADETHTVCTKCQSNSPGIPVPLMRVGSKVVWVCNTAMLLGVCEDSLEFVDKDVVKPWCRQVDSIHKSAQQFKLRLLQQQHPIAQLAGPQIKQYNKGLATDIYYNGEKLGVVVLRIWNTVNCGLPKNVETELTTQLDNLGEGDEYSAETTTMFAETGYQVKSCTLGAGGEADCIDANKMECGSRLSPLDYNTCENQVSQRNIGLEDIPWINDASKCTSDLLEFLTCAA